MKKSHLFTGLLSALLLIPSALVAFPPAPDHVFFGTVRDEWGNPLNTRAEIILESAAGVKVTSRVIPGLAPGSNYELKTPMDAGLTSDPYQPTAMRPTTPFKIRVRIGQTDYLPVEMSGDFARLGQPGVRTRLDLTLGEDSDRDGLPDAWERMLIAAGGANLTLADINGDDDFDRDGLTNAQEYRSGTYAFDPDHGFSLEVVGMDENRPLLEFLAIRGRTYTIDSSGDLKQWQTVQFQLTTDENESPVRENYQANDVRQLRVKVANAPDQGIRFYRLRVQ